MTGVSVEVKRFDVDESISGMTQEEIKEKQVDTRVVIIVSHQKKIINNVKRDWIVTGSSSRPIQIESDKSE